MSTTYGFDRDTVLKIKHDHERLSQLILNLASTVNRLDDPRIRQQRGIAFYNTTTEDIPEYAVMRVKDESPRGEQCVTDVEKPSATFSRMYLLNTKPALGEAQFGKAALTQPYMLALYDDAETPAYGDTWGAKPTSWKLTKGYPGFTVIGVHSSTDKTVWVQPDLPISRLLGRTTAAVVAGTVTTDYEIMLGTRGSDTATTFDPPSAFSVRGIDDDKDVLLLWLPGGWEMIPLDCND